MAFQIAIQLASTATLLELRAAITSSTDIPPEKQQRMRAGVPPKALDTSKGDGLSLTDLGLRSGDVLIVQEGRAESASVTSSGSFHTPSTQPTAVSTLPTPVQAVPPKALDTHNPASSSKQAAIPSHQQTAGLSGVQRISDLSGTSTRPLEGAPARNDRPQQPVQLGSGATASSGAMPVLRGTDDANIKVDGGWMVLRVVPDDNSCMFTSLAIVLESGRSGASTKLRKVVADKIKEDPFTWSEPVLGMQPAKYCEHIQKSTSWGGAIELAILSQVYDVEIDSVDVQSGRADRFGEERGYETHVLLIYSGIHYDAVTFTPMEPEPGATYPYSLDFDQTQFRKTTDGYALPATLELAQKLRAKRYYTDTAGFSLRCEICKKALKGEKEAQAHAQSTGHTSFGEF